MARSPEQIVLDFAAAFARKDVAFIMDAMSDDIVYANVPIPALYGKEAVRQDVFSYGSNQVSIPLMGIFVLCGELIAEWRDYADIGTFVKQMAAIGQKPGVSASA